MPLRSPQNEWDDAAGATAGHGRRQRHARLVLRRRAATSTTTPPSRTASTIVAEGADVVDVGGESTRPGAEPVPVDEELRAGRARRRSARRRRAGLASTPARPRWPKRRSPRAPRWSTTCRPRSTRSPRPRGRRSAGSPCTCSATRARCSEHPTYDDVVADVARLPRRPGRRRPRRRACEEVWIDPGIGFGKTPSHNWSLLRHLDVLVATGLSRRRSAPAASGSSACARGVRRPCRRRARAGRRPARGVRGDGGLGDGARRSDGAGA